MKPWIIPNRQNLTGKITALACKGPALGFLVLVLTGSFLFAQDLPTKLKLPALIGDHMVIQRDLPVHVWGWAKPGETVNVTLGNAAASGSADAEGKWSVQLKKMEASVAPMEMTIKGGADTVTIKDILVGDVWVCSGQSNMGFPLGNCKNKEELSQANHPGIRLFQVKAEPAAKPQLDCDGQWTLCMPDTAKYFSAVGYYFGKEIAQSQKVPVGLIGSYEGASSAQPWLSLDALKSDPNLKQSYLDPVSAVLNDPAAAKAAHDKWLAEGGAKYAEDVKKRNMERYQAQQKKEPTNFPQLTPPSPEPPYFSQKHSFPTVLFNARIYPLVNYPVRGAIWYQGESNGPFYAKLIGALIKDWRTHWKIGDFPFLIVQLPNKSKQQKDPSEPNTRWADIRENQLKVHQAVPNTGLVVTIDLGSTEDRDENVNLHPPEKGNVGGRLALAARHYAYGEKVVYSGPEFENAKMDGNKIRIMFSQVGDGLKIGTPPKNSLTPVPPTDALKGFAIAGSDRKFVAAKASIDGQNSVLVWSDSVKDPVFVRYGWQFSPIVNLYNSADLPASPFRTDTDVEK